MSIEQLYFFAEICQMATVFFFGVACCSACFWLYFRNQVTKNTPQNVVTEVAQFGMVVYCKVDGQPAYQNLSLTIKPTEDKKLCWAFEGNLIDEKSGFVYPVEAQRAALHIWAAKAKIQIV